MPATASNIPARPAVYDSGWFGGNMPVARFGLILNLLLPLLILAWDGVHGRLGADPVNYAIHTTGLCAVTFLIASLCVTPLRSLLGWSWLTQFRRSLGVFAFYYGFSHLAIYFWWDRSHNLQNTVSEIFHRYYLLIGFGSLVLMAPLWATSFNAAIQTMGATWWKRLHRLAYIAAGLACYHFYLQSKADKRRPDVYLAILAVLLLWRVGVAAANRWRAKAKAASMEEARAPEQKARFWKGQLKVVGMFRETPSVRTFRLAPVDGGSIPFDYKAGQFLNLSLDFSGERIGRSYTIASPPTRDAYIELTIKREENGKVSRHLHDMLVTGTSISISAPAGRFTFDPSSSHSILLVGGGVGITPVMSILRDLTDHCWPGTIDLVFSVRSSNDIIFQEELAYLAKRNSNLKVHVTATRDLPQDWTGLRGRISAELLRKCVPDAANRPVYLCGPEAMAADVQKELLLVGVPPDRIHVESFTPAAAVARDADQSPGDEMAEAAAAMVTFQRSQRTAKLGAKQTILEAAEAAGVEIEYQCRSGICGTCRCKLFHGKVTMPVRDALSDADEADGYILACQAHAKGDVVVDA